MSSQTQKAKLPPLDMVPAADQIGWMVNNLVDSVNRLTEYSGEMLKKIGTMT